MNPAPIDNTALSSNTAPTNHARPHLTVLYRGALETCNYACHYCPFAKTKETPYKKQQDIDGLVAFVRWITQQPQQDFDICFTPWGEALPFKRYQRALIWLSHLPNVQRIIIQTNLSTNLDFLAQCNQRKLSFWCTYHPTEVKRQQFLQQIAILQQSQIAHSVGMVGNPHFFDEIAALRSQLPHSTYLWINAYRLQQQSYPYTPEQLAWLGDIDPHFWLNTYDYPSRGLPCLAGQHSITVDEFGRMRRCHFVGQVIGSIHQTDWANALKPRSCPRPICNCHIGYVHLPHLKLHAQFGEQPLARIAVANHQ